MTSDKLIDAIFQAKVQGASDESIMNEFSVSLNEIETAIIKKTGLNLNLFSRKTACKTLNPKDFKLESTTVWSFKNRGSWATHNGNYRGNWSPYIPRNIILRYSSIDDVVLDQFCGGGTTAIEAKLLGRRCIARDISPAAIALTQSNLNFEISQETLDCAFDEVETYEPELSVGDARSLDDIDDNSIDLICTHPPYANIIQYSNGLSGDISFHDIDEFLEDMTLVAQECFRVLKPGHYCAILIGDTRRKKHVVPLGFKTIQKFLKQGFLLHELIIKRQHNCRTTGFWYSNSIKYNFLLLAQEYLPVFIKPASGKCSTNEATQTHQQQVSLIKSSPKTPPPPPTMETKTTWVFTSETKQNLTESNILNRYGGDGSILLIDISSPNSKSLYSSLDGPYDLILIKSSVLDESSQDVLSAYLEKLTTLLSNIHKQIKPNGHLVIITRDVRIGSYLRPIAIDIFSAPNPILKIKEIVIIAESDPPPKRDEFLQQVHEYAIIYRKSA